MEVLTAAFITLFMGLIPVTNPIGMAPIFLSYTEDLPKYQKRTYALKVAILAFFFLLGILIFGPFILEIFGISISFIKISGGLLLAITGWQMLSSNKDSREDRINSIKTLKKAIFFPITFPVTVGAGSIAIVTTLASSYGNSNSTLSTMLLNYTGGVLAITADMILVAICYGYSKEIFSRLGETGTEVVTRISAFILIAIGFQVTWGGLQNIIIETVKIVGN